MATRKHKVDTDQVIEWLNHTNGYSILAPEFFLRMGISAARVKRYTHTFSDDPELGKHAATRNDGSPGPVRGVSEFSAVEMVAAELGVKLPHSIKLGRGSRFREERDALLHALAVPL